jgi:hypothetical protein
MKNPASSGVPLPAYNGKAPVLSAVLIAGCSSLHETEAAWAGDQIVALSLLDSLDSVTTFILGRSLSPSLSM